MKTEKVYQYLGQNGILKTKIDLKDVPRSTIYVLFSDYGKILTNGEQRVRTISVYENELNNWVEIEDSVD